MYCNRHILFVLLFYYYIYGWSRDSSVVIATGWTARVRFPEGVRIFSSTQGPDPHIQWASGALSRGKTAGA
jgi:hypothetical protein